MPTPFSLLIASRPWSWTASLVSVLVAHTLTSTSFFTPSLIRFVLIGVLVQTAGNLSNTYFDWKQGCDTDKMKGGDRTLVDKVVSPSLLLVLSVLSAIAAVAVAAPFLSNVDTQRVFGLGMLLTFGYTAPPLKLKYRALGDAVIIACFGPLLMQFVSLVNTGTFNPTVTLFSIPISLITELILHANNTRDIKSDKESGCTTLAVLIGLSASKIVFKLFLFSAYVAIATIAYSTSNPALLLPIVTVPLAVDLTKNINTFGLKVSIVFDERIDEKRSDEHLAFALVSLARVLTIVSLP